MGSAYITTLAFCTLILSAIALWGCSNNNLEFIQGKWERGNLHFYDVWTFEGGRFSHEFSITMMNPQLITGSYQIVDNQEDRLVLELFDIRAPHSGDPQEVAVVRDREADTLKIGGRIYERFSP